MSDFEKKRDEAAAAFYSCHNSPYRQYAFCAGADWARMVLDAGIHSELIKERDALKAELSAAAESMNAHDKSRANVILERDALKAEVERLNALLNYPHLPLYKESDELAKERAKSRRLAEVVKEVMTWIASWEPSFCDDPEWDDTELKVRIALEACEEKK